MNIPLVRNSRSFPSPKNRIMQGPGVVRIRTLFTKIKAVSSCQQLYLTFITTFTLQRGPFAEQTYYGEISKVYKQRSSISKYCAVKQERFSLTIFWLFLNWNWAIRINSWFSKNFVQESQLCFADRQRKLIYVLTCLFAKYTIGWLTPSNVLPIFNLQPCVQPSRTKCQRDRNPNNPMAFLHYKKNKNFF